MAQATQGGGAVTIPGGVQNRVDVAQRDVVSGHGGDGLVVGLDDPSGLLHLNDSMILYISKHFRPAGVEGHPD